MEDVKIVSIKIQLENREIYLDIETAQALYEELKKLFPEPAITLTEVGELKTTTVPTVWYPPYITWGNSTSEWWWKYPTITISSTMKGNN
jgi:hypothetical protein